MKNVATLLTLAALATPVASLVTGGGLAPPAIVAAADPKAEGALKVPESLRQRHEAFAAEFARATKEPGKVGDAASSIEKTAAAHFAKAKEVFAPLGLLPLLAEGQIPAGSIKARETAESLGEKLPQIRREHGELVAGLQRLAQAAREEAKPEYARFTEQLILHIREEEEILYPAVLLVGEHLKQKPDKK